MLMNQKRMFDRYYCNDVQKVVSEALYTEGEANVNKKNHVCSLFCINFQI